MSNTKNDQIIHTTDLMPICDTVYKCKGIFSEISNANKDITRSSYSANYLPIYNIWAKKGKCATSVHDSSGQIPQSAVASQALLNSWKTNGYESAMVKSIKNSNLSYSTNGVVPRTSDFSQMQ